MSVWIVIIADLYMVSMIIGGVLTPDVFFSLSSQYCYLLDCHERLQSVYTLMGIISGENLINMMHQDMRLTTCKVEDISTVQYMYIQIAHLPFTSSWTTSSPT
ncbi:hypothetical protein M432DRAFT_614048 [Thermoascus aurantiacus ATCC 26904]